MTIHAPPPRVLPLQWTAFIILSVGSLFLAGLIASNLGKQNAYEALQQEASGRLAVDSALLRSELEKQRAIPLVLGEDPDVKSALQDQKPDQISALNLKLEKLDAGAQAAVIYLITANGRAIAASNWRNSTDSPIGVDYRFRSYFQQAMREGSSEYFALGILTRRPGLFIARRILGSSGPLGVIVVKVPFDRIEGEWRRSGSYVYVTDPSGVVIISSAPEWYFMRDGPIGPVKAAEIRESRQFGKTSLAPLPISPVRQTDGGGSLVTLPGRGLFMSLIAPVPTADWHIHVLVAGQRQIETTARDARSTAILSLLPLLALGGVLLYRRQRAKIREADAIAARAELEVRVEARTAELRAINVQLNTEMDERQKAETKLHTVREELIQANRLAVLGQIVAGVAHEVNQPVAAIRTYADNASTFLKRGEVSAAEQNLATIADLTGRIGGITGELRDFSRKSTDQFGPTGVLEVFEGALMLLAGKIRQQRVKLIVERPPASVKVWGKLIRLEQVLINLLQNALDVLAGRPDATISLSTVLTEDEVRIVVEDNGPGVSEGMLPQLFTPFNTSKKHGLGLGLVISKDIVGEMGGQLELSASNPGKTAFTIRLRRVH